MKDSLKQFFADNPSASEVHVALGYMCSTPEEASAKLAGVPSSVSTLYTREQVEEMFSEKPKEEKEHQLLTQFKKVPLDKMQKLIEQQADLVAKKEASLKGEADQQKAVSSLEFHKSLLSAMQAAFADKQAKAGE